MTQQEFADFVRSICPHCAKGAVARQREDSKEWVHDFAPTGANFQRQGHTICMATHFRNSKMAEITP